MNKINDKWQHFVIALIVIIVIVGIQQIYWINKIDLDSN